MVRELLVGLAGCRLNVDLFDDWFWKADSVGVYSVKLAYHCFLLAAALTSILVKSNLLCRGIVLADLRCVLCGQTEEVGDHLFLLCYVT
jgi:hypothetical protein